MQAAQWDRQDPHCAEPTGQRFQTRAVGSHSSVKDAETSRHRSQLGRLEGHQMSGRFMMCLSRWIICIGLEGCFPWDCAIRASAKW